MRPLQFRARSGQVIPMRNSGELPKARLRVKLCCRSRPGQVSQLRGSGWGRPWYKSDSDYCIFLIEGPYHPGRPTRDCLGGRGDREPC